MTTSNTPAMHSQYYGCAYSDWPGNKDLCRAGLQDNHLAALNNNLVVMVGA